MIKEIFKKKIPISANRFLNIKDIQGNFLYTTDGKVLAYLKIYPKNCKLMSKEEQKNHSNILTRNFAFGRLSISPQKSESLDTIIKDVIPSR